MDQLVPPDHKEQHLKLAIYTLGFQIGLSLNCQFGAPKFNLLLAILQRRKKSHSIKLGMAIWPKFWWNTEGQENRLKFMPLVVHPKISLLCCSCLICANCEIAKLCSSYLRAQIWYYANSSTINSLLLLKDDVWRVQFVFSVDWMLMMMPLAILWVSSRFSCLPQHPLSTFT